MTADLASATRPTAGDPDASVLGRWARRGGWLLPGVLGSVALGTLVARGRASTPAVLARRLQHPTAG